MRSFWDRFFTLNARFLIGQLETLFPGEPIGAILIFHTKGRSSMSEITVHDDEATLRSTITLLDAEGQPASLDAPPTYTSSDENVLTVTPSDDGLSATYQVGSPGDATVTVDTGLTDADGNEIVGKGTVHVTPGNVATVGLDFQTG